MCATVTLRRGEEMGDQRGEVVGALAEAPIDVRSLADGDGRELAWTVAGQGRAVVAVAAGISHLALDWSEHPGSGLLRGIAERHRLIRYDRPGTGLADRSRWDFSVDAEVEALLRVLDAAGEGTAALLAGWLSGPVALVAAARHPDRVDRLVLLGTGACICGEDGRGCAGAGLAVNEALAALAGADWGLASRTVAELLGPWSDAATVGRLAAYHRNAISGAAMSSLLHERSRVDVRGLLPEIAAPALLVHHRDDRVVPAAAVRDLLCRLPDAHLVTLDGAHNVVLPEETAMILGLLGDFLDAPATALTRRETDVLRHVAAGCSNREVAQRLRISEATVARHLANVYAKLDVDRRGRAVAVARERGILVDR